MRTGIAAETKRGAFLRAPTFWAFIGSLALAALFGWQTVLHVTTGIVGGRADGYENLWNDWWFRVALLDLHRSPFFSAWIEYPTGTSLRFHTLNPLGGLIALPLAPLVGGIAALNLKILFALAFSTFFAYLLLRDLTGSPLPAFAGAAVYTYANDQMILGALKGTENYLMGAALLPLYCCLLLRAATRPRWVGPTIGASATLLALALTDWQYTLFAIIFTVLYFLIAVVQRRDRRFAATRLARFAAIGAVWAVITLPTLILPLLAEARRSPWVAVGEWQASSHAKALFDFLEPGYQNPGYLVLAATVIGLTIFWRRAEWRADRAAVVCWACVAAFGLVLSFGPTLQTRLDQATLIPLPYALANALPLISISRKPFLYYTSFGMLGIGALLAFALRALLPAIGRVVARVTRRAAGLGMLRAVSGGFVALLLVGTLIPSLMNTREGDITPPDWPAFYRDVLAKDPEPYAILESPLFVRQRGRSDALYQAFQIVHGKYRFGSSVARDHKADNPDLFVKRATLFRDFFNANPSIIEIYRPSATPDFLTPPAYDVVGLPLLNYYHVRYLVLYLDALSEGVPPGWTRRAARCARHSARPPRRSTRTPRWRSTACRTRRRAPCRSSSTPAASAGGRRRRRRRTCPSAG